MSQFKDPVFEPKEDIKTAAAQMCERLGIKSAYETEKFFAVIETKTREIEIDAFRRGFEMAERTAKDAVINTLLKELELLRS